MVEHCVFTFSEYCRQEAFRSYITDGIKCMSESIATRYGGSYLQVRYAEIMERKEEAESKTGDEIAMDVISRAGLKIRSE